MKTLPTMIAVAFARNYGFIWQATSNVLHDLNEAGLDPWVAEIGLDDPPGAGSWIWEGTQRWQETRSFEGEVDIDVAYEGAWRPTTVDEALQLATGVRLWPETHFPGCNQPIAACTCEQP